MKEWSDKWFSVFHYSEALVFFKGQSVKGFEQLQTENSPECSGAPSRVIHSLIHFVCECISSQTRCQFAALLKCVSGASQQWCLGCSD